jgi:hypothetical protein
MQFSASRLRHTFRSEEYQPFILLGLIGFFFYILYILGNLTPYCTVDVATNGTKYFTSEDYIWSSQQQSSFKELAKKLDQSILEAEKWKLKAQENWKLLHEPKRESTLLPQKYNENEPEENGESKSFNPSKWEVELFEDHKQLAKEYKGRIAPLVAILEQTATGSILELGSNLVMTDLLHRLAANEMKRSVLSTVSCPTFFKCALQK